MAPAVGRKAYQRLWLGIPLYWMFLAISRGVIFWRVDTTLEADVDYLVGSPIERAVLSGLILLGILILLGRKEKSISALHNRHVVVLLYAVMLLSILWSRFPFVSAKRFIKTAGTLVMVACVLTDDDSQKTAEQLLNWFFILTLGLSLGFIHLLPTLGRSVHVLGGESWIGISYTKNNLGQVAGLAVLFYSWRMLFRRPVHRVMLNVMMLFVSVYLLVGARSATALAMSLIGIMILLVLRHRHISNARTLAIAACFTGAIVLLMVALVRWVAANPILVLAVQLLGRDTTFTGRTDLWQDLSRYWSARPALGYGFGGFWVGDLGHDLWTKYLWNPNQAHNGYLDILLQIGLVGLVLVGWLIVMSYKGSISALYMRKRTAVLAFVFLTTILINNMFESSLIRMNNLLWFVFLLFAMMPKQRRNQIPDTTVRH